MRRRRGGIRRAVTAAPRAISFLSWQKRYGRKDRWRREIALTRLKSLSFRSAFSRYPVRRPNALRAAAQLGFPSAQYAIQIVLFAPVEYLTYGIRSVSNIKRLVGADASVRPTLPQSISTTTPACQIRICSAFCRSESVSAQAKPRGKSKEGGRSPLLGRFKGDCQGGRVPTRIQRSDSCGKRRNNGTDDACPPQAADRMRDVEFVPTQIPLDWFTFHRQRPFPLTSKEKGAE